jgi:hypothetical protein
MNCDLSAPDATCPRCGFVSKVRGAIRQCRKPKPNLCGPGCQLQRTLGWFGLKDDRTCRCKAYAAQMDAWGPDECIRRIEEIVQHLREAAAKRGLPFLATAARIAIGRAVEAARQEMSHGQEAVSEARETNVGRSE